MPQVGPAILTNWAYEHRNCAAWGTATRGRSCCAKAGCTRRGRRCWRSQTLFGSWTFGHPTRRSLQSLMTLGVSGDSKLQVRDIEESSARKTGPDRGMQNAAVCSWIYQALQAVSLGLGLPCRVEFRGTGVSRSYSNLPRAADGTNSSRIDARGRAPSRVTTRRSRFWRGSMTTGRLTGKAAT